MVRQGQGKVFFGRVCGWGGGVGFEGVGECVGGRFLYSN